MTACFYFKKSSNSYLVKDWQKHVKNKFADSGLGSVLVALN